MAFRKENITKKFERAKHARDCKEAQKKANKGKKLFIVEIEYFDPSFYLPKLNGSPESEETNGLTRTSRAVVSCMTEEEAKEEALNLYNFRCYEQKKVLSVKELSS